MKMRRLLWFGALLTATGCRADGPIAIAHAADRADAGAGGGGAAAAQCSGPPLSVGDLTVEWEQQEVVRHLELKASHLLLDGADAGRISGACVLDPRGRVLRAVDDSGAVRGSGGELLGTLVRRDSIRVDGTWVRIGYVLTDSQRPGSAISDSGDPFIVPVKDPPVPAVGHVEGDVVRARRTALVLWNLGPTLPMATP